jgi:lambda family phage portal protein
MSAAKTRAPAKAGAAKPSTSVVPAKRPTARYLRPDKAGVLAMRRAVTRDAKHDVFEAAERASALATDFMQNSGWLAGAAVQILCDTIGEELKLNCRAQLKKFGYSEEDANAWCRDVEAAWRRWAWNPKECDLAGVATVAEMLDGVLRSYLASGEAFGVLDYLTAGQRQRLGVTTGIKVSLVAPHRCPRNTSLFEGIDQGVIKDALGRPEYFRFRQQSDGIDQTKDVPAVDVIHVMDRGENLNAPRGISPMTPALKVGAQSDQLADATLATALLQTIFAATIESPEPSEVAFQAIQTLADTEEPAGWSGELGAWQEYVGGIQQDLIEVWGQRIDSLKGGGINLSDAARVAHTGPGESLKFHTAATPGSNYLPFSQNLQREMARCLGITFESFTGDHSGATFSSVRMSMACIWPVVLRRRSRICAPFVQAIYERWLEEAIAERRIPFKGGPQAFLRDKESVFQAEFRGPDRPSADPYKDMLAAEKRLELCLSSIDDETTALGKNPQEVQTQIASEMKAMEKAGIPTPFGRKTGGGAGPQGSATEGNRTPSRVDA